jgi:Family of unknown function (DUF6624)
MGPPTSAPARLRPSVAGSRSPAAARLVAVCVLALLAPAPAAAQGASADTTLQHCVSLDTATAWMARRRAWSDDSTSRWTNDSLRQVLLRLGRADQAVRQGGGDLADSASSATFMRRMAATDSADARALQGIVDRFGWPTRSLVGVDGAEAAFLIAQHNPPLQPEARRLMRALPPAEYFPGDWAMLDDRIRVHEGMPQRYGTQLSIRGGEAMTFDPIQDVAHLDQRRAAVGLPPVDTYMCLMQALYGRPVVDPRPAR